VSDHEEAHSKTDHGEEAHSSLCNLALYSDYSGSHLYYGSLCNLHFDSRLYYSSLCNLYSDSHQVSINHRR
jgi:hypothetical protein